MSTFSPFRALGPALVLFPLASLAAAQVRSQSITVIPTGPTVTSLTLINADTNQPVPGYDPIPAAATLDLSKLPARLNLRANTLGAVGSVRFGLDSHGNYRVQNSAPYSLCSDQGGDYEACPASVFSPGTHQVIAVPHAAVNGGGAAGSGVLVSFTVVRSAAPAPALAVTSLTLINADTDRPVPGYDPIPAGARLKLSALPPRLNVRANTTAGVRSVRFTYSGKSDVENEAPFALCSDTRDRSGKKGDYFACKASVFAPGEHRITFTPFSKMFAGGTAGQPLVWTFTVER
ncbi:hypothetical protein [Deinococcus sp. YIM 77859]|uniref:hypothetical protein n=1 Tax=Deinococcus sp. YIM 77859 TaxID=1540221 RepID=UPI00054D51F1|nr:hypothetical protein [Deinococcus sp. YIM 77859]